MAAKYTYSDNSAYRTAKGGKKVFDLGFLALFLAEAQSLELVQQASVWNISVSTVKRVRREARIRLLSRDPEGKTIREKGKRIYQRGFLNEVRKDAKMLSPTLLALKYDMGKGEMSYVVDEAKVDADTNGPFLKPPKTTAQKLAAARAKRMASEEYRKKEQARFERIIYAKVSREMGRKEKDIAAELGVSKSTISRYVKKSAFLTISNYEKRSPFPVN